MITPCIHFNGNCNEAINFYKDALGAAVKEMYYAMDAPDYNTLSLPPSFVMHSEVIICGMNFFVDRLITIFSFFTTTEFRLPIICVNGYFAT